MRQHPAVSACLLDHGLYLVSDWAILNDTKPDQLYRIWTQHYNLSPLEAEQACLLLESFRLIYTPERRPGSRCKDPTPDQLDRIAQTLSTKAAQPISTPEMQNNSPSSANACAPTEYSPEAAKSGASASMTPRP
ncbi:MAG: hypothetical protein HC860_10055 [Alkalinema sp. RU_4_3]|nr:hypothetical protein [Alkalinema sp. RU_4_3]